MTTTLCKRLQRRTMHPIHKDRRLVVILDPSGKIGLREERRRIAQPLKLL